MRKVQIGSKVSLLNQVGEGVVTALTKDGRFLVLMSDGFEIPFFENELIVIGEDSASQNERASSPVKAGSNLQNALYATFTLSGTKGDLPLVEFKLLSKRSESFLFVLYSETEKQFNLETNGSITANSSISIMNLLLPELLKKDRFFIQIQPFSNSSETPPLSWSGFIKHQVPQLIDPSSWPTVDELSGRALTIQVFPDRKKNEEVSRNKSRDNASKMLKASQEWLLKPGRDGRFEVDLHIEELLENTAGMDNSEIIRYQLRFFEKCMDEAKGRPIKRFIAIHGVGKGRLRDEIRKILSEENIEHYDAPLSKYGYGATEIIIG
jgi:hypothetical protein